MNVLILSGSPKKKGGASRFFGRVLGRFLPGCNVKQRSIHNHSQYADALEALRSIDVLVLSVPLYVDGMPSNVMEFLTEAEQFCRDNHLQFTFYAMSNNGFVEGRQNEIHLKMYECWCEHAAITWGGGIGIGGGVMLRVLSIAYPISLLFTLILIGIAALNGEAMSWELWRPFVENAGMYLFLNLGVLYLMTRFSSAIRKQSPFKNQYTRVMVPSFLFIPFADIFMALLALFNGKLVFSLFKRNHYSENLLKFP